MTYFLVSIVGLIFAASSFAGQHPVGMIDLSGVGQFQAVSTKFVVDSFESSIQVSLIRVRRTHGRSGSHTKTTVVKNEILPVEGLSLVGNELLLQTAEKTVICGTMGESPVFRIPTLYLSGKCEISTAEVKVNGVSRLKVSISTK